MTMFIQSDKVLGECDAQYRIVSDIDSCRDRCLANLAAQRQLGILPEWRPGSGIADIGHCGTDRSLIMANDKQINSETQINQADPNPQVENDTLHSDEVSARLLMDIFVNHFKLLTGEALLASKLSSVWYDKQKSQEDLINGLEYAKAQEWIVALDEAFRLTEAGFHAAAVAGK
jgi:hypothetical protein